MLTASRTCYHRAMRTMRAITLRLNPLDYDRLETEARRLGLAPAILARVYVRAGLTGKAQNEEESKRRAGLEALDQLEVLRQEVRRAGYPSVDAAQVMRESREELEQRPHV